MYLRCRGVDGDKLYYLGMSCSRLDGKKEKHDTSLASSHGVAAALSLTG